VFIVDETQLSREQAEFVAAYFREQVRPTLMPLMLDEDTSMPELRDRSVYLAVALSSADETERYALIELPTDTLPRFVTLPAAGEQRYVILLDDVIRFGLKEVFSVFGCSKAKAYTIKMTRDAELDIDQDVSESLIRKVHKSVKQRKLANPVRFVYDSEIPGPLYKFLVRRLQLDKKESDLIPGGRYHNFKDFMEFPRVGPPHLQYDAAAPLPHPGLTSKGGMFKAIQEKDVLLQYPYHRFDHLINLLMEASIDPRVTAIKITLYRVAQRSNVINALINAARNGKSVTVILELQARFDEEVNVAWAQLLQEEGVRVIDGVPGLKVHAKLVLITRKDKRKTQRYACIGTGNFNETTARLYSDACILTSDPRITKEVEKVIEFMESTYRRESFRHLLVAPFNMRKKLVKYIDQAIEAARGGEKAAIILKLNNLVDQQLIGRLYKANSAGVDVRLMVRGMFSLLTEHEGMSDRIQATGLVDRFLEHTRFYVFQAGAKKRIFLSSADLMVRNLDYRVEVACPIYDKNVQKEIEDFLEIHWQDNVKTRMLTRKLDNPYRPSDSERRIRAQELLFEYFSDRRALKARLATPPEPPVKEPAGSDGEVAARMDG
jgi:polyphosphate kinase